MALSIGIVGLPNVGKSTVFNALTQAQNAEVANYPFCTIQPNRAVVPVPDARLERLAEMVPHDSVTHVTLEFVDIAGLVAGASRGEGLGNKFLAQIREASAILHGALLRRPQRRPSALPDPRRYRDRQPRTDVGGPATTDSRMERLRTPGQRRPQARAWRKQPAP